MTRGGSARVWLGLFALVAALNLVAELFRLNAMSGVTLLLLMPCLAGFLVTSARRPGFARSRTISLVLLALIFSWLGDSVGFLFLVKLALFLMAQICYIVAFWPDRRRSVLRRPPFLAAYTLVIAALVVVVSRESGSLLVPVVIYGGSVGLMAVLATGVNRTAAVGGMAFIVSDTILALDSFVPSFALPGAGFWIMATYIVAQGLLVLGSLRAAYAGRR